LVEIIAAGWNVYTNLIMQVAFVEPGTKKQGRLVETYLVRLLQYLQFVKTCYSATTCLIR
jgi:hypothetical protein